MRNRFISGVSALALLAIAGHGSSVEAAGPDNWSGFYAGLHAGYGEANLDSIFDNTDVGASIDEVNGIIGGVHGGFNFIVDSGSEGIDGFLFGIEGDISLPAWDDSDIVSGTTSDSFRAEVDLLASVRGRVGVFFDRFLIYATGGVAFIEGDYFGNDSGAISKRNFSDVGGVVGGGVEFSAFDFAHVRFEGLYYLFDDNEDLSGLTGTSEVGDFAELDDAFVVRAGISVPLSNLFGSGN